MYKYRHTYKLFNRGFWQYRHTEKYKTHFSYLTSGFHEIAYLQLMEHDLGNTMNIPLPAMVRMKFNILI